mgnify:CR=1 FL=1
MKKCPLCNQILHKNIIEIIKFFVYFCSLIILMFLFFHKFDHWADNYFDTRIIKQNYKQ